jgi:L-threonylcarbamoyladenylate synthase
VGTFVEIRSREDPEWEDAACAALESGGVLVHPTTSVYGIGGSERRADAIVARLKGRAESVPILRLVYDVEQLLDLHPTIRWSEKAELLAEVFWPGPLTLILDDGSESGLAVRAEAHPVMRRLLFRFGEGIGSTSLNLTGDPPAQTVRDARHVLEAMPELDRPLHFLSAGDLPGPPTSTLLSLRGSVPRILRVGAIRREQIEKLIGAAAPIDEEGSP